MENSSNHHKDWALEIISTICQSEKVDLNPKIFEDVYDLIEQNFSKPDLTKELETLIHSYAK